MSDAVERDDTQENYHSFGLFRTLIVPIAGEIDVFGICTGAGTLPCRYTWPIWCLRNADRGVEPNTWDTGDMSTQGDPVSRPRRRHEVDRFRMDDGEHTRGLQTGLAVPTTPVVHPRLNIEILDLADLLPAHRRDELAGMLRRASEILRLYSGDVRVRLVGDREMSAAHERFAGVPGTTDVLTFDMRDEDDELEPGGGGLDVDIWVCVDEARRRAAEFRHAIEREVLLYCLHGVLHCLGYDDHDPAEHARMHAEEDRVLEAIGVGRTYAPRRSAGAPDAGNEGDGGGVLGGGGGR